ncbi:MAG: WbqC family protein [Prevotella sp.]|nr:WbqC family protein [Bacteroides sp.]MCM1366657.1 WbqC family protein [Prevotella sp.]MCM1437324.1 WbqC family protein [Prevotella sp.]
MGTNLPRCQSGQECINVAMKSITLPYGATLSTLCTLMQNVDADNNLHLACKELTRCKIRGRGNQPDQLLSVPITGGNRSLRRLYRDGCDETVLESIELSEHGNWRHVHISAFETTYRSMPYFTHYSPQLLEGIQTAKTLGELLRMTQTPVMSLLSSKLKNQLHHIRISDAERTHKLKAERMDGIRPDISIYDTLFKLGPETVFLL